MNCRSHFVFLIFIIMMSRISFPQEKVDYLPALKSPYLGKKQPGMKSVLFAPDVIPTGQDVHNRVVIFPAGEYLFCNRLTPAKLGDVHREDAKIVDDFRKKASSQTNFRGKDIFAIVTYVNDSTQERSARAFIKSVRELGGKYSESKIYIVLADPTNFPCESLKGDNIVLLPIETDPTLLNYPLAIKAAVAAQVEAIVKDTASTLAWFDPATLVINSLSELDLENKYDVAIRPVSLVNTIGLTPGNPPNDYWSPIYKELGLDYKTVPAYESVVDEKPIQAYFNCEIFSVDPRLGIFTEWARVLIKFLEDAEYQKNVCNTFLRRLFLHQAVLSGVIISKVDPGDIKPLSIKTGYPFNQHEKLPDKKKIKSLNELSAIIFDYQWDRDPKWIERISIKEPLKEWLIKTYIEYLKLTDNLYRMEGSCNSYLITTKNGSVMIDPAGATAAPEYFKRVIAKYPLKAILLTHSHPDHWSNMNVWLTETTIPIIAQRDFMKSSDYRKRLAPFFARRGAIWARNPLPDPSQTQPFNPIVPTITFIDEYTYELGNFHFKMVHTPGETPDQATIWIPELKAVFVGDNYYEYFINNATLRGTTTRPMLGYIEALNLALSYNPEFFLAGHGVPVVSEAIIQKTVSNFRDALLYIYDETLKGINEGKDVYTLMREIKVPNKYLVRPYYGKVEWTVRGIYHEYIGWFDENPASMYALPASSIYADLVDICGADELIKRAKTFIEDKEYVKALHLTDVLLYSNPNSKRANETRLQALEALKARTQNYIELIWLDYGIRTAKKRIRDQNEH